MNRPTATPLETALAECAAGAALITTAPEQALVHYATAVALAPDDPVVASLHGVALRSAGQVGEAIRELLRGAALPGATADLFVQLAQCYRLVGDWRQCATAFARAAALAPGDAVILRNLAHALRWAGDLPAATAAALTALQAGPTDPQNALAASLLLHRVGRLHDAELIVRAALVHIPRDPELRFAAATLALTRGDFATGWPLHEARLELRSHTDRPPVASPCWDGAPLAGRTILVRAEQGLGDQIQFVRYAPMLRDHGAGRVIVSCYRPLVRLFSTLRGIDAVVTADEEMPPHDVHVDVMSLQWRLDASCDTVEVPYLHAPVSPVATSYGGRDGAPLRVGIAWAGSPHQVDDRFRSLAAGDLATMLTYDRVTWVVLQQGPGREALTMLPPAVRDRLEDAGADGGDLLDTAVAAASCDLVISVCTSVAHLAGAIGRPTWVMLADVADWRWVEAREDSPDYPTLRLFRQTQHADWTGVVHRVHAALEALATRRERRHTAPADTP